MQFHRLSIRYAKTLLELATEAGTVAQVRTSLDSVQAALHELKVLDAYLSDQKVSLETRHSALDELVRVFSLDKLTTNFLRVLIDRRRFLLFNEIHAAFKQMADKQDGMVLVEVTTAYPLDERERQEISKRFSAITGGTPTLSETIDRSLLGGVRIEVNNKVYDYSLSSRIARLREKLVTHKG